MKSLSQAEMFGKVSVLIGSSDLCKLLEIDRHQLSRYRSGESEMKFERAAKLIEVANDYFDFYAFKVWMLGGENAIGETIKGFNTFDEYLDGFNAGNARDQVCNILTDCAAEFKYYDEWHDYNLKSVPNWAIDLLCKIVLDRKAI